MPIDASLHADRGRAESFGTVAAKYDRFRPSYPVAMIEDLVALGGRSVLDVGCGTGKAAVLLSARGLDVLGVEIDPKMAEVARGHGLAVEVSSFEGWADGGRQFDLLTCGQAWHWVDPERGVAKAAGVVRPGGTVALFWNYDVLADPAQDALDEVYREYAPELVPDGRRGPSVDEEPIRTPFERSAAFGTVESRSYAWQRTFGADEWVGMTLTHSDHLMLPAARRTALAAALHATVTRLGGLTADYRTYLFLARRAG